MGLFDPSQIANLVGQIGGNHQQAAQLLQGLAGQGQQVDTSQHGDMLQQMGIDPQQLEQGGYQQHFDAQNQSGFQGYQAGGDMGNQQFGNNDPFGGQQQGGYGQGQGYGQNQGYSDQGYADQGGQDQGYQQGGNF